MPVRSFAVAAFAQAVYSSSMADDCDGAKGHDGFEGPASVGADSATAAAIKSDGDSIYHRLIQEQRLELEQLKRAAREASPSSSSSR